MQVKRCFIALPLDEIAVADLSEFMDTLEIEGLRLTRPENLHVTLKFLGDVEDPKLPGVITSLREAAGEVNTFDLQVTAAAYMPNARRARVLAAVCGGPPAELTTLFERVEDTMHAAGFPREGRAYHPHITLGRFRKPPRHLPATESLGLAPMVFPVSAIVLMESDLGRGGATYTPLAALPLRR